MNAESLIDQSAIVVNSTFGKKCSIGANTRFCYSHIDDYSYVSVNSNIFSTKIEKFSSISWNVSINPAKHDYRRFTQHPILFAKKYGMLPFPDSTPYYQQYQDVHIGNDVWIGCNSVIHGGVRIGDGAVIGAGAQISHDVSPYAIVVGRNNHLKNRFSDEIIEGLLSLRWWNFPIEIIQEIVPILAKEPTLSLINNLKELEDKRDN